MDSTDNHSLQSHRQRLASVTKNGVTAGSYQYDGRGLRTVKTVNGEDTLFIDCKSGRLLAEADNDGHILKEYVYLEGNIFAHFQYEVPIVAPDEAVVNGDPLPETGPEPVAAETSEKAVPSFAAETSTPSNTAFLQAIYFLLLLQNKSAEGAYYYITDHLGSPQVITDDSGAVVWKAEYLPFGNVNIAAAQIENNLRFPGQYYDAENGLHYNWNRYYDPETGRYIAADPIGLDGGTSLYAYVGADPVNSVDPWGLKVELCQRPAPIIWGIVDHNWLKTDTKEAGGIIPGEDAPTSLFPETEIVDHAGESSKAGSSCREQKCVDEDCVILSTGTD